MPAKGTITFYTGQAQLNSVCRCYMKSFHGKFVEISVSDNGSGIDFNDMIKIVLRDTNQKFEFSCIFGCYFCQKFHFYS